NSIKKRDERGIGLVETMLALGIGVIIITSMVSLAIFTMRTSLQNKLNLEGTQLANQEIERVRAFRDSRTWATFLADIDGSNGIDCFATDCHMVEGSSPTVGAGVYVIGQGTPQELRRSFRITDQSGGQDALLRISVTVNWRVGAD